MSGPSSSKSSSSTDQSTNITETTNVEIDEIGLTGNAAVGIVEAIAAGAVAQSAALSRFATQLTEANNKFDPIAKKPQSDNHLPPAKSDADFLPLALAAAGAIALVWSISK